MFYNYFSYTNNDVNKISDKEETYKSLIDLYQLELKDLN